MDHDQQHRVDPREALADSILPHDRHLTLDQLAAEAGVDASLARRLRRAMGLPDAPDGAPEYYDEDLEALRYATKRMAEDGLDPAEMLHLTRTLGLAAAHMAEAVTEFWVDRGRSRPATGAGTGDGLADRAELPPPWLTAERVADLHRVVGYLLRRHLLDSVTRRVGAGTAAGSDDAVAVGFADLVGFTTLSQRMTERETAELIERFEVMTTELVVAGGGRVVKMIGDEVMFVTEPAGAGEIALSLTESFDSPDLPSVRVGAAAGSVVAQAGDLYGPVVNQASRATMSARPGTVLVSVPLGDVLSGDPRYSVARLRPRRLKGLGLVELMMVRRAPGAEASHRARPARRRRRPASASGRPGPDRVVHRPST